VSQNDCFRHVCWLLGAGHRAKGSGILSPGEQAGRGIFLMILVSGVNYKIKIVFNNVVVIYFISDGAQCSDESPII
jgi:hypothetical protein